MEKRFRFITAIALLTAMCLAACNKVELTEDPIDEPGTEVSPSQGWTVAISATIGGDASTKALTEDPSTHKLIATFETTDNIYVYNRTKDKQDATVLHPDRSGATAVISGTLTGEYDAADEIVLCYNMDEYHRFHYLGQKGTLATVADFAKAEKTITVAEATDKALSGSVSFDNLQSIFRFTFTDGSSTVPVRSVSISTAGDKLVQTDLRYKPDWNSMYYGAVDVEPDATTTDPITVALRNENASDDTFYFEVDNGSGVIYKGTKPAPAGKIVNGKFYESTVTLTQVPKPTVINTNDASAIEPNYGNYGYLDAGNLTVSGTGVGYYFSWAEQTFKSLTLSGANLTSLEQEPISSASSILNPIIIEGDNFIVTDASHAGIKYKSYRSGTTFTQTIRGNGTLTVTASNTIGVKGFLDSYNESNAVAAASGYVLTVSEGVDNGDGTSTWVYTVRPEAVDLGLPSGTKWASMNVGASSKTEYGDYFAWGETTGYNSGKTNFSWSTYFDTSDGGSTFTEYYNGGKTELDVDDDAAYQNWGSHWRMPSKEQCEELINSSYTTVEWTTVSGVNGRLITSKSNSNSIFIPALSNCDGSGIRTSLSGSWGYCWTRTLTSTNTKAWYLTFSSSNIWVNNEDNRAYGLPVRAVWVE